MMILTRIRNWIDGAEWRPVAIAIAICEMPILIACLLIAGWQVLLETAVGSVLLLGWVALILAALTRWQR